MIQAFSPNVKNFFDRQSIFLRIIKKGPANLPGPLPVGKMYLLFRGISSAGRASGSQSEGRGFDPHMLHSRNGVKSMAIMHIVHDAAGEEYPASKKPGASLAKGCSFIRDKQFEPDLIS